MSPFKSKDKAKLEEERLLAESQMPGGPKPAEVEHKDIGKTRSIAGKIIGGLGEVAGFITATVFATAIFSFVTIMTGMGALPLGFIFFAVGLLGMLGGHYLKFGPEGFGMQGATA
jgi:hypothetical protein